MSAATAAIAFALQIDDPDEGMEFLGLWNEGEFDLIRDAWPDAPEAIYDADPLSAANSEAMEMNDVLKSTFSAGRGVLLIPAATDPGLIGDLVTDALDKAQGAPFIIQQAKAPEEGAQSL